MHPKVLATINYLKICSDNDLRKKLSQTPSNWSISFPKASKEYIAISTAYMSNCSSPKSRAIYHPTAVKLVNLI